jgi:hypothetical protein
MPKWWIRKDMEEKCDGMFQGTMVIFTRRDQWVTHGTSGQKLSIRKSNAGPSEYDSGLAAMLRKSVTWQTDARCLCYQDLLLEMWTRLNWPRGWYSRRWILWWPQIVYHKEISSPSRKSVHSYGVDTQWMSVSIHWELSMSHHRSSEGLLRGLKLTTILTEITAHRCEIILNTVVPMTASLV